MIVELKVIMATCVALLCGAGASVLNGLNANAALLGSVPHWAQGIVLTGAPTIATALLTYQTNHTPRPDLEKDAVAVFERYKGQLADYLASKEPKYAAIVDEILGVTPAAATPVLVFNAPVGPPADAATAADPVLTGAAPGKPETDPVLQD